LLDKIQESELGPAIFFTLAFCKHSKRKDRDGCENRNISNRITENIEKRFRESIAWISDRISKYSSSEWNVVFYHDYHVCFNNAGNIFHNLLLFHGLGFFFYDEDLCFYLLDENVYKSFFVQKFIYQTNASSCCEHSFFNKQKK